MKVTGPSEGTRRGAALMLGASGLTTLGSIPPFLLGAQAVWVRDDLGMGLGIFGIAVSTFFAFAAIGALPAGLILDRIGRRWGLVLSGMLVASGGVVVAVVAQSPPVLIAAMALLGLGNAFCQTSANLSMARVLPAHRRGLGFGVKQSAVPFAIMIGGLSVPTIGGAFGWRSTFISTAAVGVLVMLSALRPGTKSAGRVAPPSREDLDRPPWGPIVLASAGIVFASAAANFLGSFIASYGAETGLSPNAAGVLMAAGSGASIAMRVYSGFRADGRAGRNLPVVAAQMYAGMLGLLGLAFATPSTPIVTVIFGFLAFSVGWAWPGLLLYAVTRVSRDTPGRGSGAIQAGAFLGGALGPAGFGALIPVVGFELTWVLAAASFLIAGSLVLLARRGFSADIRNRPPRSPLVIGGGRLAKLQPKDGQL